MSRSILKSVLFFSVFMLLVFSEARADNLSPGSGLFQPGGPINASPGQAEAPDMYHKPQSRHNYNQVPEKLEFIFRGHQGMGNMGAHYISDVQTLLSDLEFINQRAWNDLMNKFGSEFRSYSNNRSLAMRSSVPAGAMAVAALDNAGGIAEKNFEFGTKFLFEGLGNQRGSDCQGTVRGMLDGTCQWGTPPVIEAQVFSNIIGDDVNLSQLGGAYEVWGVSPARSTLINLIFSQGLFQ